MEDTEVTLLELGLSPGRAGPRDCGDPVLAAAAALAAAAQEAHTHYTAEDLTALAEEAALDLILERLAESLALTEGVGETLTAVWKWIYANISRFWDWVMRAVVGDAYERGYRHTYDTAHGEFRREAEQRQKEYERTRQANAAARIEIPDYAELASAFERLPSILGGGSMAEVRRGVDELHEEIESIGQRPPRVISSREAGGELERIAQVLPRLKVTWDRVSDQMRTRIARLEDGDPDARHVMHRLSTLNQMAVVPCVKAHRVLQRAAGRTTEGGSWVSPEQHRDAIAAEAADPVALAATALAEAADRAAGTHCAAFLGELAYHAALAEAGGAVSWGKRFMSGKDDHVLAEIERELGNIKSTSDKRELLLFIDKLLSEVKKSISFGKGGHTVGTAANAGLGAYFAMDMIRVVGDTGARFGLMAAMAGSQAAGVKATGWFLVKLFTSLQLVTLSFTAILIIRHLHHLYNLCSGDLRRYMKKLQLLRGQVAAVVIADEPPHAREMKP